MPDLTVSLIQTGLIWEDIDANLARLDLKIDDLAGTADLIVLPEMFTTGFSNAASRLAETMSGRAATWLQAKSRSTGAAIAGSLIIEEAGHYYNRLVCCQPDGTVITYDKKHLFRYAGEEKVYSAGRSRTDIVIRKWRIRPFICYDLRFPIWTRNLPLNPNPDRTPPPIPNGGPAYDLALFVANWPMARAKHWRTLLKARAIENQAYVVGVNRIGTDGNGIAYSGGSMMISPRGEVLIDAGDCETIATMALNRRELETYRNAFPAWMDADGDLGITLNNR